MVIEMKKAKFVLRAGSLLAGSAPGLFKERNYRLNPGANTLKIQKQL